MKKLKGILVCLALVCLLAACATNQSQDGSAIDTSETSVSVLIPVEPDAEHVPVIEPEPVTEPEPIPDPVPAGFVRIPGGTFTIGSPESEPERRSDEVQRQVTISSFYMGMYPVTQKEYEEVMGTNPSNFRGDNLPVEMVSWFNAIEYCNRRSLLEGLTPAYIVDGTNVTWNKDANGYRLPTEAEWEYACRAGTTTPFNTGENITTDQANYNGTPYNNNVRGDDRRRTTPVGTFAANLWGLFDKHGNVWEWCWDWYGRYAAGDQTDPIGPATGSNRVLRGGSWYNGGQIIRSAYRGAHTPSHRFSNGGFRLARNAN